MLTHSIPCDGLLTKTFILFQNKIIRTSMTNRDKALGRGDFFSFRIQNKYLEKFCGTQKLSLTL